MPGPELSLPTDMRGQCLGLAVSGGGDSMALLALAGEWAKANGSTLQVATVDHGLRAESADEARFVAQVCAEHGLRHHTLRWERAADGPSNLQEAARIGRYQVLAAWAQRERLAAVCLAHTQDDCAETLLMRLARGSGIDGLAQMRTDFAREGMRFLRPLLGVSRADLREYLRREGLSWCEDPSNDDNRFQRVRVRQMIEALGLDQSALAQTAKTLRGAQEALAFYTSELAAKAVQVGPDGLMTLDRAAVLAAPQDIQHRLLARLFGGASDHPPRAEKIARVLAALEAGQGALTLSGFQIEVSQTAVVVFREPSRTPTAINYTPGAWDGRWILRGEAAGLNLAPLGESGLAARDWRGSGLHRKALLTTPALYSGEELRISPVLDPHPAVSATPLHPWSLETLR
ncbi:MAG: tRNA lysidine(34) synthetase TilS [Pseudomonadota bacterium]